MISMRRYASVALFGVLAGTSHLLAAQSTIEQEDTGVPGAKPAVQGDDYALLPPTPLQAKAAAALNTPYTGTPIDVTTYHYDTMRTGWNPNETELTPASVASKSFGLLDTLTVDGTVMAQPLLVSGFVMPDGSTHDVLLVATENNSIYAYDAQNYTLLWQINLGLAQTSTDVGCGDVIPEYGISSTPVIVVNSSSSATIYVIAATETTPFNFQAYLHAIDLGTGNDLYPPVEINPSTTLSNHSTLGFSAQNQWSRAGLVWANNSIYIGIGSHCDDDWTSISGWLLRYGPDLSSLASFHTIDNAGNGTTVELASIWMAGFAPAVDSAGNIYVVTGNGPFNLATGGLNYGESALKLSPDLSQVMSYFTPANYVYLNQLDVDFGSGGIMLLPSNTVTTTPLAVAMGKFAEMYLLNTNSLGGFQANDAGALQATRISTNAGLWGGPAYFGDSAPKVYYQVKNDVLRAFGLSGTAAQPTLKLVAVGTTKAGFGGSMPIVSSNGTTANTGVVWLTRRLSTVQLEAYNADTLGRPIYAASAGTWPTSTNKGLSNAFVTPLEANGRVYVGAAGTVSVFGLTK